MASRIRSASGFLLLWIFTIQGSLSAQVVPDSLQRADSLQLPDSLQIQDTIPEGQEADSGIIRILPRMVDPLPAGLQTGVWEWDREDLVGNRAITLADLVSQIPGVVMLRAGDAGMPLGATAFAAGAGRIRVYVDGIELVPLEGGTIDLTRVALGGMETVRVRRGAGGLRIDLEPAAPTDHRPASTVEAGTGDLSTNLFRGTFIHPSALGGSVFFNMERMDSQGTRAEEPGSASGAWVRYSFLRGEDLGLAVDYRRMAADRGESYAPGEVSRTDWSVRARWRFAEGATAELFNAESGLKEEEGTEFAHKVESRRQLGGRLLVERERVWGSLAARKMGAEGLPDWDLEAELGVSLPDMGGASASLARESWSTASGTITHLRAWTAPFRGLSAFAELESGQRGVPWLPPLPPPPDTTTGGEDDPPAEDPVETEKISPRLVERSGTRIGAQIAWRGIALSGARLSFEADSLLPLGLVTDEGSLTLPGEKRTGYEVVGSIPLRAEGLALRGSYQWWKPLVEDQPPVPVIDPDTGEPVLDPDTGEPVMTEGEKAPLSPYLPERMWQAEVTYHNTFLPTGNLEIWADIGVQGRDGMAHALTDPEGDPESPSLVEVPWFQSWYARLQIRVVTVRVFMLWENFTVRDGNQDYPGRLLPATRAVYGVRWTLWN